jgi:hypothetical protein
MASLINGKNGQSVAVLPIDMVQILNLQPHTELRSAISAISEDIDNVLAQTPVPLGKANPPTATGIYIFSMNDKVMYVGEAKGRKGLKDRLLSKHISGDDSHAIQRAFKEDFPDRRVRRDQIRRSVNAQWLEISDELRVSAVERTLIWMFDPPWNVK